MSDITITEKQLAAIIKIKTDAQDRFYELTNHKTIAKMAPVDRAQAMYYKGKEEAVSLALYLMDIRSK